MITVVSKQPHPSVVKEVICNNCGCTLQYVPNDVKKHTVTDYRGDAELVKYIVCPECSNEIDVRS